MTSTEQLEREAEQTRAQLAASLDELRTRLSPGEIVDQLSDYVRNGGGAEFVSNLREQTIRNPLALGLVGTGLAWLMLGGRAPSAASLFRRARRETSWAGRTREPAHALVDTAEGLRRRAAESATDMATSVRSSAQEIGDSAMRTGRTLRDRAGALAGTVAEGASSATQRTMETGSSLAAFCRDQPLLLAGLGLAMGAIAGALLPRTETEDRLMGEASDAAKDEAGQVVSEQVEHARQAAHEAVGSGARSGSVTPQEGGALQADPRQPDITGAEVRDKEGHEVTLVPDDSRPGWPSENARS